MIRSSAPKLRFAFLAAVAVALAPRAAAAHAYIVSPPSRDLAIADLDDRAHKTGPCGGSPRIGSPTKYAPGELVTVKFEETVDHRGCYQVVFSPAKDANWQVLKQINDPTNAPKGFQTTVTLPTKPCPACTLGVRQIMYGAACPNNPQDPTDSPGGTYYSCADVCIGPTCTDASPPDGGVKDAGATPDAGGSDDELDDAGPTSSGAAPSGGSGQSSSDAKPTRTAPQPVDEGGCALATSDASTPSVAALVGIIAIASLRRRRAR